LVVRDSFGSWLPGGHFLVSGAEQNIVAKGMQVLKQWTQTWRPRYIIVEENAINHTFRAPQAVEQEVGVFYYTWHSRKMLHQNL
jgi:hypothetical protein